MYCFNIYKKGSHFFLVSSFDAHIMNLDYTSICQMRKLRYRARSDLLKHLQRDGSGRGTGIQVWLTQVWTTFPHGQQFNNAKLIISEKESPLQDGKASAGVSAHVMNGKNF